ncbi:MAG: hypothetical protein R6X25_16180 [Candidatus Krumholzibacteriia bacterium]
MKLQRLWLILAAVAMLAMSGCIFSPDDDNDDPPPPIPRPELTTKDAVITNYALVYADRDIDAYGNLLHGDFVFEDTDREITNYDDEMTTTRNMFTEQPGRDENDRVVPGLSSINATLTAIDSWQEVSPEHPYFGGVGAQVRAYRVEFIFQPSGATYFFQVEGPANFYVIPVDGDEWRLLGIEDRTVI